jgi:tetratricopeptide (TPR) repeat protein
MVEMYFLCRMIMKRMERTVKKVSCLLLLCLSFASARAQEEAKKPQEQKRSVTSSASKLSKTLEERKPDEEVAGDYLELAKELASKEACDKAEDYLTRALKIYLKLKRNDDAARTYRELAKVQEAQQKITEAIANYNHAAQLSKETQRELNVNDANRLKDASNPYRQSVHIQKNIDLLQTPDARKEKAEAYQQMAQVKMEMDDKTGAINELEAALKETESEPEAFKIKQEIANTLTADKKYKDAIALSESLLAEAQQTNNPAVTILQLQNLGTTYFEANHPSKGFDALQKAYLLAVDEGQTLAAKKVLEQLVERCRKTHDITLAMSVYADFISRLDTLIKNDSSLVDTRFFQLHEEKITQLENERQLKDELIARKNNYNYVLSGSMILILAALLVISGMLMSNLRKNKKIALQSLRREMNPHFIFNSLNSVNRFIAQNKELEANKYLSSYSKLMRNIMENSNRDFIPLSTEMEQLKEYLDLEHQRFQDKFTYRIEVDEALDTDLVLIPNMVIQPQLENAVWHGLRYKEESGQLSLTVRPEGGRICVTVEDNGIGLKQSQSLKTEHQKEHHSRGMSNTRERIDLLNKLYHVHITITVIEKEGDESGVKVVLCFPLMHKTEQTK